MKILFENKQLNEGPGAGYTVSGTLTNVKIDRIVNYRVKDRDADITEWLVEVIGSADFVDVSANSYYYGGTIDSTNVSIIRVALEGEKEEPTVEDVKWALEKAKIEANLGGGWSHSTFDGYIDVDYNGIDNAPYTTGVEFKLIDAKAITYLDKAVQNENTETQYGVVENHWVEAAFDTSEEAIQFAKENGYENVQELYVLIDINGDEIDTEFGDIVWTNDDVDESLREDITDDVKKETEDALTNGSTKEMSNVIFDTLFGNTQYPQFDFSKVENQEVDANKGQIVFDYMGHEYKITIEETSDNFTESHTKSLTEDFDDDERINALATYLNIDPSEISNTYDYEFETPEGDYYVVTEDEAEELAKEDIRNLYDDLGLESFTSSFRDWIIMNALDNDWFEEAVRESYEYYVEDIEDEASSMGYDNRLIEEMHDHQVLSDDDFEEDEDGEPDLRNLKDYVDIDSAKEEFIDLLVENAGNAVEYCGDNYGWDWVAEMASQHNLIDLEEVVDQCIYEDGIAHFIARYDGEEIELENGLYAYRTN